MNQPLGTLARTHTCGALTAADVGQDVVLLGWVHRVRDLGVARLHRHSRPSRHHAGRRARQRGARRAWRSGCARSMSSRCSGVSRRARRRRSTRRSDRRDRGPRARDPAAERRQDAAVPDRRRVAGVRGHAAEVPLPRSAALAHAAQPRAAAPGHDGGAEVLRRAGLSRDRDADAHQVDARRGARLPRAEPRAPRRVLRAAAVAADLQADPDDRRASIATSRSSSASATRTCAPTASPSSPRSTSRCRSRPRTWCSRPSSR